MVGEPVGTRREADLTHNGQLASNGRDSVSAGIDSCIVPEFGSGDGRAAEKLGERGPVRGNAVEIERLPIECEVLARQQTF